VLACSVFQECCASLGALPCTALLVCRKRVRFLIDLEADGWQLDAPVDDTFACLRNVHPKPPEERRLVEAWEIGAPGLLAGRGCGLAGWCCCRRAGWLPDGLLADPSCPCRPCAAQRACCSCFPHACATAAPTLLLQWSNGRRALSGTAGPPARTSQLHDNAGISRPLARQDQDPPR
jgi:hypothetical protein